MPAERLFPLTFLADVGISPKVVRWLLEKGYDSIHLVEEGLERWKDKQIYEKAVREGRIVLSFDLDFAEIASFSQEQFTSVIIDRLKNTRTPFVSVSKKH